MSDSPGRRKAQMQALVGTSAKAEVWSTRDGFVRYQVRCRECRWVSRSNPDWIGQGTSFRDAMEQWQDHAHAGAASTA